MGKKRERGAEGTRGGWWVHYVGGGPWDGAWKPHSQPIDSHLLTITDGEMEGFQVYEMVHCCPASQRIVLAFAGERWPEPF